MSTERSEWMGWIKARVGILDALEFWEKMIMEEEW